MRNCAFGESAIFLLVLGTGRRREDRVSESGGAYVWHDVFEPAVCLEVFGCAGALTLGGALNIDGAVVAGDFWSGVSR